MRVLALFATQFAEKPFHLGDNSLSNHNRGLIAAPPPSAHAKAHPNVTRTAPP